MEKVFFDLEERKMCAYFSHRSRDCVVFAHGFRSSKESQKATTLWGICRGLDLSFMALDFGGCGESQGSLYETTLSGRIHELQGALRFFAEKGIERYVLVGSSFGALVSLYCADAENVICSVYIACPVYWKEPAPSPSGDFEMDGVSVSPRFFKDVVRYQPLVQAASVRHGLVIHGQKDLVVSLENGKALYEALTRPKKLVVIEGGDHRLSKQLQREQAMREIASWIKRWR